VEESYNLCKLTVGAGLIKTFSFVIQTKKFLLVSLLI
jgi:hypothetical protein